MTCEACAELLSAYLDGEAAPGERATVESHLAECRDCSARLASIRAVKHAVARLPSREAPPGAIQARIESLRLSGPKGKGWVLRGSLLLAAAGLSLAVAAFLSTGRDRRASRLAADLVADHLRSVREAMPAEVVSHDPQEVVRFFESRTPFRPVAPALPDAELVGGRLCRIGDRRAELLFYRRDGQTLSLFVVDRGIGTPWCRQVSGQHVCGRRAGDLNLMLVGQISAAEAERLLEEASL